MRLTPWLSLFPRSLSARKKRPVQLQRPSRSLQDGLERLEDRVLLSTLYVDDNLFITTDNGAPGLSAGDIVTFANGETAQQTGLTFGTNAFSTIPSAITAAVSGVDDIVVAKGTYLSATTINVNKSVSITGVADNIDDVLVQRSGLRGSTEDRVIEVLSPNVTIAHLKVGGWQNVPTVGEVGTGYNVWTTQAFTTLDEVNLFGDDLRVGVYIGTSNDFTFTNSRITGTYFRAGIRGAGERMDISYNKFEESHFWYSPIYMEYGGPTSGSIDHNYFANRVGVNNDVFGDFKEDGTGLNAITNLQPNTTTADGLTIEYNTFDFRDANLVNSSGASPSATGVFIQPNLTPSGPIVVQNNIFQGYQFTGVVPTDSALPQWHPAGGVFGGALEFDGINDFGTFQSPLFDVGTTGTLSFWVKIDDTSHRNQFFEGPGNAGFEFQYRENSNGQFFGRTTTVGGDVVLSTGNQNNAQGVWTNLQYTWDFNASDATGKMRIYRDGTELAYVAGSTPNDLTWAAVVSTINGVMNVGRDPGSPERYFDGTMDDVAFFNSVLTTGELTSVRTSGASVLQADSRMVAHWDFDQSSGSVAVDSKNNIPMTITTDGSQVAPVFVPAGGQFGGALEFDGVDDFATFSSQAFDVGTQGTLNFWVRMDNTGKRNQFFEGPGNSNFEFQYRTNGGGQFYGRVTGDGDFVIRSGGDASAGGVWTNLQYTWDFNASNATGKMHIYRDGVESGYLAGLTPNDLTWASIANTTEGIMNVGRDPGDPARFFDGRMDDVAWFNRVLSPAELASIRVTNVGAVLPANLVAYWNMDDAPGTLTVPGDGGTGISLYLGANPPPPPPGASAILGPVTTVVDYNLFFNNEQDFNGAVAEGANNIFGTNPRFVGIGADPEDYYTLKFGSPAINASSDFPSDNEHRHIGAFQGVPVPPASVVYVDDNWSAVLFGADPDGAGPALFFGVDSFATIQEAVDLVDDDGLIIIYNGTYTENVTITRQVELDGESAVGVIVDPPAGTAFTISGAGNDVVIQDLTVTGADTAFSVTNLDSFTLADVASSSNTSGGIISNVTTLTYTAAGGADIVNATGTSLSNTGALTFDAVTLASIGTFIINGGAGGDTFNITPPTNAEATNMSVNGDADTDTLVVDTSLMGTPVHNLTGLGSGNFTSTTNTTLFYATMEVVDTTTAIPTVINGNAGADNYEVQRNGANLEVYLAGVLQASIDFASMTTLTFNGQGGDDTLLVDLIGGVTIPAGGLFYNGGAGTSDKLAVRGTNGQVVVYTPDAVTNGNGVIDIDGDLITFTGLEPVDFDNVGSFTLNLPNDDDVVTVTNDFNTVVTGALEPVGTVPALRFSGTSGGVGFESAYVFRTTDVTVDTTLNTDGNDTLTIASANNLHANTNLTFISGAGTDNLIVNGATIVTGTFTANVPLVNLNNNITAATIAGTPTVVNVNNNTAQIQDGVDVAATGATVNVASGFTYAEAVAIGKDLSLQAVGAASAAIGATTGPALTVTSGVVNMTGFDATTSAASPTISVTGGSLKLRQNGIVKSGAAPGAAIVATGAGVLDLGANPVAGTSDPGNNSITGVGALVSSATAVDASGNWWGTTVQATIGAALTANVDYSPFLNSGTDSAGATPGFQSSFSDLTVHTAGPQTGPDPRITEGYNTLSNLGGIIHVLTGSYTENVDLGAVNPVDKVVTFHAGASPGQVSITGDLIFSANDTLPIELTAYVAPDAAGPIAESMVSDNFTVTGTVNLGGATLQPIVTYAAQPFDRFTIINSLGAGAVVGTFAGAAEGFIYNVGGVRLRVSYVEFHNTGSLPATPSFFGDGNDVSLTVMTPPVLVELTTSGTLNITGTGWVDDFDLEVSGTNQITLRGNDVTNFQFGNTNTQILGPITVTGDINVSLGNSNDRVLLRGVGAGATFDSGNMLIELGSGNDSVTTTDITAPITLTSGLSFTGDLTILGGTGDDVISLGGLAAADTFSANAISIDTGTGGIQSVTLDRTTVGTNVSLKNGGAGLQTVALGLAGPTTGNSIGRDLVITNADGATGYEVDVQNTGVGRNLQITNGSGSGAASVTVNTTALPNRTIGGLTQITNGNNVTNAVTLAGSAAATLRFAGNVTVKNGNATTSNDITVTNVTDTANSAASFTNGTSPDNSIVFNGTLANTFVGIVAATNGTSTGTNVITAERLTARGLTFKNGNATTSNAITLGGADLTDLVVVNGNTSLTNGDSADIVVNIDRLTAGAPSGNVTIANGASGAGGTDVIIGAVAAANSITGNLTITNQVSTGTRTNTINNATVSGGGGLSINDFGSGVSAINIGTTALVTVAKKLDIQDGSSSATTTIDTATVGSMTYNDLGGGTDTINLANAAGTFQNNGVTRLSLGAGSDTVNIAIAGTAIFNDSVFISLGSGNDILNIGASANSPAFSAANRFQFDGGAGVDQITVSPLSIADYVVGNVPKKLKSKITNFESIL